MADGDIERARLRVSQQERDDAEDRLRIAAGEGRITLEELDARLETALSARTYADLAAVTDDLPVPAAAAVPAAPVPVAAAPVRRSLRLAAGHGHVERLGVWQVPPHIRLELDHAAAAIDLHAPALPVEGVHIDIDARHSRIVLLVAADRVVDVEELGLHQGKTTDRGARAAGRGGAPAIRVTGDLLHSRLKVRRAVD